MQKESKKVEMTDEDVASCFERECLDPQDPQDGDALVVSSKFKWKDLYSSEDWLGIWIGFIVIGIGYLSIVTGAFTFKSTKIGTWGNEKVPTLFDAISASTISGILFTFVVLAVLFGIGNILMGKKVGKYIVGFKVDPKSRTN